MITAGGINLVCHHHYVEEEQKRLGERQGWREGALQYLSHLGEYAKAPVGTFDPQETIQVLMLAYMSAHQWRKLAEQFIDTEDLAECDDCLEKIRTIDEQRQSRSPVEEVAWYTRHMIEALNCESKAADLQQPFLRGLLEACAIDESYLPENRRRFDELRDELVNHDLHKETDRLFQYTQQAMKNIGVDDAAVQKANAPLFDIEEAA